MDVKYQVFVSSTYSDLTEERRKVMEAILNLGHIPVGMEGFQPTDETQWDYIQQRIDQSDYYVVIVAERYGSEKGGKSYTQLEYEYAVKIGVPVAAFLLSDDARQKLPANLVDFPKKDKIEKFRVLCKKKLIRYWSNIDDLANQVSQGLPALMRTKPRIGWVRADKMPSNKVISELALLSEEKRELQQRLAELSKDDDEIRIPPEVLWRIARLEEKTIDEAAFLHPREKTTSLLDAFLDLDHCLATGADIYEVAEFFANVIGYQIEEHEIELVMTEFVKHALVQGSSVSSGATRIRAFGFTESGKQFLMYAQVWKARNRPIAAETEE